MTPFRLRPSYLPILPGVLSLSVATNGCKKPIEEALVRFQVEVDGQVPAFARLIFSVTNPSGVPNRTANGETGHRTFRFGYYMPGVNGTVNIRGSAVDADGCTIGEGTLVVTGVAAGQTTDGGTMTIPKVATSCNGADASSDRPGDVLGDGATGTGGAGIADGGMDRAGVGGTSGTGGATGTGGISTLANLGLAAQYALVGPLVVTGSRVYVQGANLGANTTGLISVSLPNGVGNAAPPFLAGTTMSVNNWIAAWGDDTAIYFANTAAQWVTCPASGCAGPPTVLSDASAALPYLVGDAQAIYWLNTTHDPNTGVAIGSAVMKIAR